MKVQEVLKVANRNLPGTAPSLTADRALTVVAPIQKPNRIAGRHEPLGSQNIFPDAALDDGMNGDVPPALDSSPASLAHISTPHTPDLDFIKTQIARLPRRTEQ
jgi:hypothetical protein